MKGDQNWIYVSTFMWGFTWGKNVETSPMILYYLNLCLNVTSSSEVHSEELVTECEYILNV